MVGWDIVEKYLSEIEKAYTEIGTAGYFALNLTIRPLRDRFNKGERTDELYEEIMSLE
jgi:hypothetical protein